ncbi:ankyrin repeat-containing domain protein [Xylaria telfairii]|nr:ankyrin repeat-containing domain protein [Xylaria telfairii]
MHILDLPPELFHKILVSSILARCLKDPQRGTIRAFRLKLISKAFYHAFQPALFESRVLDNFNSDDSLRHWSIRKHYGGDQLWHSYLVYRVGNETDPTVGRFVEIQLTAKELCVATKTDYDKIVGGLCWLALEIGARCPGQRELWVDHSGRRNDPPNPRLNLLSAAAYFGHLGLAKQLLDDGCCPTQNDLFPSPMQLAAFAGNADMVILFQEHLPDIEDEYTGDRFTDWKANTGLGAIYGAALRGDMDILRLAIDPPSRATLHSSDFNGQKIGEVDPQSYAGRVLREAQSLTRSWEVFEYITSLLRPSHPHSTTFVAMNAERGNIDMVQRLLDSEWLMDPRYPKDGNRYAVFARTSLIRATRGFHEDIVDLLLKRGANPNDDHMPERFGSALSAAAAVGSMRMIRKLMEYGAKIDVHERQQRLMLKKALLVEHTEMVNFFYDQGLLDRKCPAFLRKVIEEEGLESMLELLKKWE